MRHKSASMATQSMEKGQTLNVPNHNAKVGYRFPTSKNRYRVRFLPLE